ncbi:hypothetical protein [Candidatus Palauibacter polyketidifaciens]|uniref:hypothetical protein n=1 Tax=Candidatus Palauibacter polyketidifaciens TaxID=3056740 RepID=UPI0023975539|nr:hypothetical protein [Candidatus Palauibacter polyketidifaciens]MDE2720868.1 hypothetical protein [Candidatus Palauibacter polyketidifaciens]
MKGPYRISAWLVVFLAGCGGDDTLDPEPQPTPPAAPPPAPIAASVVIETRKIVQDYLSGVELDFNEWASTDTLIIRPGLTSPVIRVTARQEDGNVVSGVEPTVRFTTGTDDVTYRTLVGDSLRQIWLQREGSRFWTIFDLGTPAEAQILTVTARVGRAADSLVVILPTALDTAGAPGTLPEGVTLDNIGDRASTPLDWFASRAGADISYEFHVGAFPVDEFHIGETPVDGPPNLDLRQNDSGELEITAVGRGRRYLHYRALSSAFELSTGRMLTAVDDCYAPELENRPLYDRASTGFQVELVYDEPDDWSRCARVMFDHAAGFYEAALKDNAEPQDFPIFVFDGEEDCGGLACGGPRGLRVNRRAGAGFYFSAGGIYWTRDRPYVAPFGRVPDNFTYEVMLHELGHVFGIGTYWYQGDVRLVNLPSSTRRVDTHFPGANAVVAFDAAGGSGYTGAKVPVTNDPAEDADAGGHWRSVLCGEIMTRGNCPGEELTVVSAITLGALADLGWVVDMSVAEDYMLPSRDMAASVRVDTAGGYNDVLMRVEPPDRR